MKCFSELIDHGHGKYTLFGRVLADTPDDPERQNVRSANIAIPPGLLTDHSAEMRAWHTILPDLSRILVSACA